MVVQVMVESGVARSFATTDVILLTKEDPNVSFPAFQHHSTRSILLKLYVLDFNLLTHHDVHHFCTSFAKYRYADLCMHAPTNLHGMP